MTADTNIASVRQEGARYPRNCDVRTVDASAKEVSESFERSLHTMGYGIDKRIGEHGAISLAAKIPSFNMASLLKRLGRHEAEIAITESQHGIAQTRITLRSHPAFCKRFCIALGLYLLDFHVVFNLALESAKMGSPFLGALFFGILGILCVGMLAFVLFAFNGKSRHSALCDELFLRVAEDIGATAQVKQQMRGSFEVTVAVSLVLFTLPLPFLFRLNDPIVGGASRFLFVILFLLACIHYYVGRPVTKMTSVTIPGIVILGISFFLSFIGIFPFFVWASGFLPGAVSASALPALLLALGVSLAFVPSFFDAVIQELERTSSMEAAEPFKRWDFSDSLTAGLLALSGVLQWLGALFGICSIWTLLTGHTTAFGSINMVSIFQRIHDWRLVWYVLLASYWVLFFLPFSFLVYRNISSAAKEWKLKDHQADIPQARLKETVDCVENICTWAGICTPRIIFSNIGLNDAHVKIPLIPFSRCTLTIPAEACRVLSGDEFEALLAHEIGHLAHQHVLKISILNFLSRWMFLGELGLSLFYKPSTMLETEADRFSVRWLERSGKSPYGRQGLIDLLKRLETLSIEMNLNSIRSETVGISSSDLDGWLSVTLRRELKKFRIASLEDRAAMSLRLIRLFYFEAWRSIYTYLPLDVRIKNIRDISI